MTSVVAANELYCVASAAVIYDLRARRSSFLMEAMLLMFYYAPQVVWGVVVVGGRWSVHFLHRKK